MTRWTVALWLRQTGILRWCWTRTSSISYLSGFSGLLSSIGDHKAATPFQAKMSNCIIEVAKQGYRIFDVGPEAIKNDVEGNFFVL